MVKGMAGLSLSFMVEWMNTPIILHEGKRSKKASDVWRYINKKTMKKRRIQPDLLQRQRPSPPNSAKSWWCGNKASEEQGRLWSEKPDCQISCFLEFLNTRYHDYMLPWYRAIKNGADSRNGKIRSGTLPVFACHTSLNFDLLRAWFNMWTPVHLLPSFKEGDDDSKTSCP